MKQITNIDKLLDKYPEEMRIFAEYFYDLAIEDMTIIWDKIIISNNEHIKQLTIDEHFDNISLEEFEKIIIDKNI